MPGTFGTLLGIPLAWAMLSFDPFVYMAVSVALILFASLVAEMHERAANAHDPGEIVIDEVVGYVIAMTWLPATWQSFAAAFVVFRFFDILKPFPIRQIDRKIRGGLGTVLDDVAAGLAANICLQWLYSHTPWLGVQFGVSHGSL